MLDTATTLYQFYSGFGYPAYTTDNVPEETEVPYITYRLVDNDWEQPISHYCILYMRTHSNHDLLTKAEEIRNAIGTGLILPCGNGYLCLHYENAEIVSGSQAGTQANQDSEIRGVYISMQLDILHL